MRRIILPFAAAICLGLFSANAPAQDDLPLVKPGVKTLAAFKNGLGFVFKSGETPLQSGWARMDELPSAALGSLWIGTTSKTGPVTDIISYRQKVSEPSAALTLAELLAANVGKRVAITYDLGASSTPVEGTLVSVPADRKPDESAWPPVRPEDYAAYRPPAEPARGEIVLIRRGNGDSGQILGVNKSAIQSVELLEGQEINSQIETERDRVKVHVGGDPASAEITLAYLEKGVIWSPSYRINIADEKTAAISLDAVLANDVEDLSNVDVSFVVGYPNFLYADVPSPLALRQSVANFVQNLLAGRRSDSLNRSGPWANTLNQSVAYGGAANDAPILPPELDSAGQPLPGEGNEDLYFYTKSGVTLKKGDRAQFEVFHASVPYEHIYQWDVADTMAVDYNGYRQNPGNLAPPPENQIWHTLRLTNNTKQPWTTAPAFTMHGPLPVAQDVLGYAPPGGSSTLKLTVATDLRAEASQTETGRQQVNIDNGNFDEITVSGKLKVTSWKPGETCIVIRKSLTGEVLDAADGKVTKLARNLAAVNPTSELEWEFHLPAGKDHEITYRYQVLIRR
jgi:hypothetical protein